ncbi:DUF262 domain-containing protein [Pedobacter hartonius]|uniref:GmrSD restriction endonucleases N-terminal domain-containing protein n=1 Tax=Pedobacter hartonius TaxID=425514 RepID=A0A1H4HFM9_9SPHI|nr:DUF262 domain-containing protein [Pedobacter hartonius]SEB20614.1 Protein of unknown function [Pedobacter hartonius]
MPKNQLFPVAELADKIFRIPNYQRGYKWSGKEVEELLIDITESDPNEIYCLQPLVVTATEEDVQKDQGQHEIINGRFDVIDGQQRLSTIYIILSYINKAIPHFTLCYQTRTGSEHFLRTIHKKPLGDNDDWKQLISQQPEEDNIDNYHFYQAYNTVHNFFNRGEVTPHYIKNKLLNNTAFIWYEIVDQYQSSEEIFKNFNAGKITLTDAELIKAMVLLQFQEYPNTEIRDLKIAEFAFEWETIEAGLQEREFWWFLGGAVLSTRIDFLLQLEAGITPGTDDQRKVYKKWESARKVGEDLAENWKKIVSEYQRLRDWSQDTYTYHRIGFLTATGSTDLVKILRWSNESTSKSAFKEELIRQIKNLFLRVREKNKVKYHPYHIDNLHYVDEPGPVRNTLLWFNVLSYELLLPDARFPFWRYNNPENIWSREHIHPQSPKDLSTIGEAIQWANEQVRIVDVEIEIKGSLEVFIKELSQSQHEAKINPDFRDRLKQLSDQITAKLELHGIGNMALLDSKTNSALSNRLFFKKREMILDAVETKDDRFIPLATRNAFCKYYSKNHDSINVSFWSINDARDYKEGIEKLLNNYLPEQPQPYI